MTEEQRFSDYLDTDTTFWGRLYRLKGVKTFDGDLRAAKEFCDDAKQYTAKTP